MWQEIAVGLMVAASAFFIGKRFWNSFKGVRTGGANCGCGCSGCDQGFNSTSDCTSPGLKERHVR
ncbi:MAG: FeoB-associated Cys-rich membrane protein [Desulfomonilaceae bacterium]